jgi:hypothetical protein
MSNPVVHLNGRTFCSVRTMAGEPLVIVQRGKMWRVASDRDTVRVLAGLNVCPLRVVTLDKMARN